MRSALLVCTLLLAISTIFAAQSPQTDAPKPDQIPANPTPAKPFQARQEMAAKRSIAVDPETDLTPEQRCDKYQGSNKQWTRYNTGELGQSLKMFMSQTSRIIQANWNPLIPKIADKPFYRAGEVKVCFAILPSGQLEPDSVLVRGKSGDEALDRAAVEAVKASIYPHLPAEYAEQRLTIQINFEYNTNRHPDPAKNLPKPPNPLGPLALTVGYTSKL
jgi:TonB family protein